MGTEFKLTPPDLNPASHRWETSKENPRLVQRRGIAAEMLVGFEKLNRQGQNDLYIQTTLRPTENASSVPLTLKYLREKIELALMVVRFQHPETATTIMWDGQQVSPVIQYESLESTEAALQWARESVEIKISSKSPQDVWYDMEEKRQKLSEKDAKQSASIKIHLIADVPSETTRLTANTPVHLLTVMNHLIWDGTGARMFVGKVLKELDNFIGTPSLSNVTLLDRFVRQLRKVFGLRTKSKASIPKLQWGQETENLCPTQLEALAMDLRDEGDGFQGRCLQALATMNEGYVSTQSNLIFLVQKYQFDRDAYSNVLIPFIGRTRRPIHNEAGSTNSPRRGSQLHC